MRWCQDQSSFSTPNMLIHVFMDFALGAGAQSCWNMSGPSTNCCHNFGSTPSSKMSLHAEALSVLCTKGQAQPPKNNPTPLFPLHQSTLGDTVRYVLLAPHKLRLINCIARQRSIIDHSRRITLPFLSPRVEWQSALNHQFWSVALHSPGYSSSVMEAYSMKLSAPCSRANLRATWWSAAIYQKISEFFAQCASPSVSLLLGLPLCECYTTL